MISVLDAFRGGGVDFWGLILLSACGAAVSVYVISCWAIKRSRARGRIPDEIGGAVRLAAARGDVQALQLLMHAPNWEPDCATTGFTALSAAAVEGRTESVIWLLQHGAAIDALKEDEWLDTPLHYAAARSHMLQPAAALDCINALLAHGADPTAKNFHGATPAELAEQTGNEAAAAYLKQVEEGQVVRPSREQYDSYRARWQQLEEQLRSEAAESLRLRKPSRWQRIWRSCCGLSNGSNCSTQGVAPHKQSSSDITGDTPQEGAGRSSNGASAAGDAVSARRSEAAVTAELASMAVKAGARGWDGLGTEGTVLKRHGPLFRGLALCAQTLSAGYIVWRALRTLTPGWYYFYSMPLFVFEFFMFCLSNIFVLSLWSTIERPERYMGEMMEPEELPSVDIIIACYSEPVEVIEPTATAALNVDWPGSKLNVYICCDDAKRTDVPRMVRRLRYQCEYMGREARLFYVCRPKVKGVPHHAKAGNINNSLLKGRTTGDYVLILDCDMIASPDILQLTIGHMHMRDASVATVTGGRDSWVPKPRCAFIQTPQDFFNVPADDPMVHCARFFYGPMLQGRDGIGCTPCCGTGVVFRRDVLVSIGGQAYGSITEDYNTAMCLLASGFSTMFLNTRLTYGMAPDEIVGVFTQRARWATGALTILAKDNPLCKPGLSPQAAFLFWEAAAYHLLALPTIIMAVVPLIYVFTGLPPLVAAHLWEFAVVFCTYYLFNRLMLLVAHSDVEGGLLEMWRGSQMWIWMSPNHIKSIWTVLAAEWGPLRWLLKRGEIGFAVTKKDKKEGSQGWEDLKAALNVTWYYLLYYLAFFAATVYFIVMAALGHYTAWQALLVLAALGWTLFIALCIWPPVATLFPRVETEDGWQIQWDAFLEVPTQAARVLSGRLNSAVLSGESIGGNRPIISRPGRTASIRASQELARASTYYALSGGLFGAPSLPITGVPEFDELLADTQPEAHTQAWHVLPAIPSEASFDTAAGSETTAAAGASAQAGEALPAAAAQQSGVRADGDDLPRTRDAQPHDSGEHKTAASNGQLVEGAGGTALQRLASMLQSGAMLTAESNAFNVHQSGGALLSGSSFTGGAGTAAARRARLLQRRASMRGSRHGGVGISSSGNVLSYVSVAGNTGAAGAVAEAAGVRPENTGYRHTGSFDMGDRRTRDEAGAAVMTVPGAHGTHDVVIQMAENSRSAAPPPVARGGRGLFGHRSLSSRQASTVLESGAFASGASNVFSSSSNVVLSGGGLVRRRSLAGVGQVDMPGRRIRAVQESGLLTGMVLPERPAPASAVALLVDEDGTLQPLPRIASPLSGSALSSGLNIQSAAGQSSRHSGGFAMASRSGQVASGLDAANMGDGAQLRVLNRQLNQSGRRGVVQALPAITESAAQEALGSGGTSASGPLEGGSQGTDRASATGGAAVAATLVPCAAGSSTTTSSSDGDAEAGAVAANLQRAQSAMAAGVWTVQEDEGGHLDVLEGLDPAQLLQQLRVERQQQPQQQGGAAGGWATFGQLLERRGSLARDLTTTEFNLVKHAATLAAFDAAMAWYFPSKAQQVVPWDGRRQVMPKAPLRSASPFALPYDGAPSPQLFARAIKQKGRPEAAGSGSSTDDGHAFSLARTDRAAGSSKPGPAVYVAGALGRLRGLLQQAASVAHSSSGSYAVEAADTSADVMPRASADQDEVQLHVQPAGGPFLQAVSPPQTLQRASLADSRADVALTSATCVLPVAPTTIFEHSLAARPNFELKQSPKKVRMFIYVNTAIILLVVASAIAEAFVNPGAATAAIG